MILWRRTRPAAGAAAATHLMAFLLGNSAPPLMIQLLAERNVRQAFAEVAE